MTMDFGVPDTAYDSTDSRRGVKLLHDPVRNKGTAFTEAERDAHSRSYPRSNVRTRLPLTDSGRGLMSAQEPTATPHRAG